MEAIKQIGKLVEAKIKKVKIDQDNFCPILTTVSQLIADQIEQGFIHQQKLISAEFVRLRGVIDSQAEEWNKVEASLRNEIKNKDNELTLIKNFIATKYPDDGYLVYPEEERLRVLKEKAEKNETRKKNLIKEITLEKRKEWTEEMEYMGIDVAKAKENIDKQLNKGDSRYNKEIKNEVQRRLKLENPPPTAEKGNDIIALENAIKTCPDETTIEKLKEIVEYKKNVLLKGEATANRNLFVNKKTYKQVLNNEESVIDPPTNENQIVNAIVVAMKTVKKDFKKSFNKTFEKRFKGPEPQYDNKKKFNEYTGEKDTMYENKVIKTSNGQTTLCSHFCRYHKYNNDHLTKDCKNFDKHIKKLISEGKLKEKRPNQVKEHRS